MWRAGARTRGAYTKFPLGNALGTWRDTAGVRLWADGGGRSKWDLSRGGLDMILALSRVWT